MQAKYQIEAGDDQELELSIRMKAKEWRQLIAVMNPSDPQADATGVAREFVSMVQSTIWTFNDATGTRWRAWPWGNVKEPA